MPGWSIGAIVTTLRPDDRPSFQFYPKDWLGEMALRSLPLSDRGLWIDMLCYMWRSEKRGYLQANGSKVQAEALARMTGAHEAEVKQSLSRMEAAGLFSTTDAGVIYSRRMVRDEKQRSSKVEAGRKGGSARNAKQTPSKGQAKAKQKPSKSQAKGGSPSPTPSPSPTAKPFKPPCSKTAAQFSAPPSPAARGQPKRRAKIDNGGAVWAQWVDAHRALNRPDPVPAGANLAAARELSKMGLPADEMAALLAAYLADRDDWIEAQGHALKLLPSRLDAYRQAAQARAQAQERDREWAESERKRVHRLDEKGRGYNVFGEPIEEAAR